MHEKRYFININSQLYDIKYTIIVFNDTENFFCF